MTTKRTQGLLFIIGGAEDHEGDCTILREFVRWGGGRDATIAVLTAATSLPREVGDDYIRVFEKLGAKKVHVVNTEEREDSDRPEAIAAIEDSTAIFFTGGDQARIIELIKGTKLDAAIRQRQTQGAIVGGTSAGAAMMPNKMIVEGDSTSSPRVETVEMGAGMGFISGVIIDQHFAQRGRLGRLLSALLLEPADIGFGIDENTALIVDGDHLKVLGEGTVTVVDEKESNYNNLDKSLKDEALAIFGAKLHILPSGYEFNLQTRQPISPHQKS